MTVYLTEILTTDNRLPETVAVAPEWRREDFNHTVLALSAELQRQSCHAVALWFEDAAFFACALLAAWHAGIRVILPPNLAEENRLWAETQADIWLSDVSTVSGSLPLITPELWQTFPESTENRLTLPENAEVWLKTSGSSGTAQVVKKTMLQMAEEARGIACVLPDWGVGCVVAGSVSPQHLYGLTFRIAVSLCMGWAIDRSQSVYPEYLLAATTHYPKTVWITSPALLARLGTERDWARYRPHLTGIISAGGVLPETVSDELAQYAVRPFEIYGSTETGVIASRRDTAAWQTLPEVVIGTDDRETLWVESPWSGGRIQTADVIRGNATGFTLHGRFDRIVKLEDKRVSLADLEGCLNHHPWIADAYCGLHPQHRRIAAWVALNEEGIAQLRTDGRAAVIESLKQALALTQDKVALPRFWRFADKLPRNPQSKITAADFQAAFTELSTKPHFETDSEQFTDGVHSVTARVPLDLSYFAGHFRRFPLVPGVVELQWVADYAQRFAWGKQQVVRVENLKYQQFLRPNDRFVLSLQYDESKNKLMFRLFDGDTVFASGRMVFAAADSGCLKGGA